MKQLIFVISIIFGLVSIASTPTTSNGEVGSVTGAAEGVFGSGAALGVVTVDALQLGTGVFIEADGSASGTVHAVLAGHSILGPQQISVEGKVTAGTGVPGSATLSGTATVDLGDGTPAVPGVAFNVTITAEGVVLSLGDTTLPAAALTGGTIVID